jgi:hypothetical protein
MTVGKTKQYCVHCAFDMQSMTEERFCPARDGDLCEARARRLRVNHFGRGLKRSGRVVPPSRPRSP